MPERGLPDKPDVRCVVREARPNDVGDFVSHMARHLAESGRGGSPHFAVTRDVDRGRLEASMGERWVMPVSLVAWARAWLLWDVEPASRRADAPRFGPRASVAPGARVVGHAELRGAYVESALHRAQLSLGIERAHVGKGHGTELVRTLVAWARAQPSLAWVDLSVFTSNAPALALYRREGFVEVGRTADAFRLDDGARIDDAQMVLRLRVD